MAESRYGSAGELLAWRPDRVGHEAFMGVTQGVTPGLWQGSAACTYNENSDAISQSASKRKNAKMVPIKADRSKMRVRVIPEL
jgi:hypothetical protein